MWETLSPAWSALVAAGLGPRSLDRAAV